MDRGFRKKNLIWIKIWSLILERETGEGEGGGEKETSIRGFPVPFTTGVTHSLGVFPHREWTCNPLLHGQAIQPMEPPRRVFGINTFLSLSFALTLSFPFPSFLPFEREGERGGETSMVASLICPDQAEPATQGIQLATFHFAETSNQLNHTGQGWH